MKNLLPVLFLIVTSGPTALAISERGGGEGVLCYNSVEIKQQIERSLSGKFGERTDLHLNELSQPPTLLDIFEIVADVKLKTGKEPELISPTQALKFQDFISNRPGKFQLLKWAFVYDSQWVGVGELPGRALDFHPVVAIPEKCLVGPIATQYFEESFVLYHAGVFAKMNKINQLALKVHEQIYRYHVQKMLDDAVQRSPYKDYDLPGLTNLEKITAVNSILRKPEPFAPNSEWVRGMVGYIFTHPSLQEADLLQFFREEPSY